MDFEFVDTTHLAQAKMDPQIVLRVEAATTTHLIDLTVVACKAVNARADCTAIRFASN